MSAPEPIFGITQPDGAVKVRLTTKFKRKGNTPVVSCEVLTQEAVQSAIDNSASLGKYLGLMEKELGEKPWAVKADLQFLGSDGGAINEPVEVEFLYYGPDGGKAPIDPVVALVGLVERLVSSSERVQVAREVTRQAELAASAQVRQAEIAALTAGIPVAAGEAAKILQAGVAPLQDLVKEQALMRAAETARADGATNDVMKALKKGAEQKPSKDAMDYLVQGTQIWPTVERMWTFLTTDKKAGPN